MHAVPSDPVREDRLTTAARALFVILCLGATGVYSLLLATDTVDGLRGNAQWHLPFVRHPENDKWWLPIIPAALIMILPALTLGLRKLLAAAIVLTCAFTYLLFAAQWEGGDNLLAKVLNGATAFHRAASDIPSIRPVLANYPAYMASTAPSHVASHPPGNLLLYRGLNDLMQVDAGLRAATLAFGRWFISGLPMLLRSGNQPYLLAGAVAAIPLIIVLGRLAAIPLAVMAGWLGAPVGAATLLFLLLPTTLVHVPMLDTAYPLLSVLVLLAGIAAAERQSWWLAAVSGALFGLSLLFSAGIAVIVIPLGVYALLRHGWGGLRLGIPFAAAWAGVWLIFWLATGVNMVAVFQYLNVYQQRFEAQRSYWLWFRWKWYEFVMFCGIPVTLLCMRFIWQAIQRLRAGVPTKLDYFFAGWLAMMIFLWISPAAKAEVGRLWAPMMCFAVLFAAQALPRGRWTLPLILGAQVAQTMLINRYLNVISPN